MRRLLLFFVLCVCAPEIAGAQTRQKPLLRTNLSASVAVPGQTIELEVTILVPTWMPKPPELPSFELPDVSVRLPEGSSRPAMEGVEGESWSGVTRTYQVSPMVVGSFRIPPQPLTVTYANPENPAEPIVALLQMKEILFEGRAPAGAEELDPFIAAEELTLEQALDGDPTALEPGAAFSRTVTARVAGAAAIFLPPLVPELEANGLAAYPKEPVFSESSNRGRTTGERVESVTYVAEAGGRFVAAPIRLRWWNLRTKEIEVAEVPALEIVSRGPPPSLRSESRPGELVRGLVVAGILVLIVAGLGRWLWPRLVAWRRRRHEERLASEAFAFEGVTDALGRQHFGDAARAIELWSARLPVFADADRERLFESLAPLGAALYGRQAHVPSKDAWSSALASLRDARRTALARGRRLERGRVLPSLNPDASSPRLD